MKSMHIELELPEGQAWAFAQLLKRITASAARELAVDQGRAALAEADYAPR